MESSSTEEPAGAVAAHRWAVPPWLDKLGGWSWRVLAAGTVAYFAITLLATLRYVALPVVIALLAAALLVPAKNRLCSLRLPDILATWLAVLAGLAFVVAIFSTASYFIGVELADTTQWDDTRAEVRNWLQTGPANLSEQEIDDLEDRGRTWITSGLGGVNGDRARLLGELAGAFFLTIVLTFFFVKDGAQMWSWTTDRIRSQRRVAVHEAGTAAFTALGGYVRGVAITGVVDGVLIGIALYLFGVPLALPLALLTFFGAFFPIVGATVVGSLGALIALVANGPRTAIFVALTTLVIQQVEGDVVMPMVMRRTVQLHPAVVLLALAAGAALGGIAGAFVAVPAAAMLSAAMRSIRSHGSTGDGQIGQAAVPATTSDGARP